jgi:hypothetical protein
MQCYFRYGKGLENGEWSYSTPRVFEEFQQKFPDFQGTNQQLAQKVYKCVNMFLETGSVLRKKGSGQPTKRTAQNIEEVKQKIAESPNKSIRRLAQETNLSFGTVQLILKKDLQFFPYRVSVVHEIKPLDFPKRVDYCQWFLNHLNYNDILDKTFLGDESWFHLKMRTEMQQNIVTQHRRVTIFCCASKILCSRG